MRTSGLRVVASEAAYDVYCGGFLWAVQSTAQALPNNVRSLAPASPPLRMTSIPS